MVAARMEDREDNHLPVMADLQVAEGEVALQHVAALLPAAAPMAEEVAAMGAGRVLLHVAEALQEMEDVKEVARLHAAEVPARELKEK
jgi:hypothetical protein